MSKQEQLFQASGKLQSTNVIKGLVPVKDHVSVTDMMFGERTLSSGVVLLNDNGRGEGIRPRWAKVYKVGPAQLDVKEGQWIFIEHGRWTRGLNVVIDDKEFTVRRVDASAIIGVQDDEPTEDDTISTAVHAPKKER